MKKIGIIVLIIVLTLLTILFTNVLIFAIQNNQWNWFRSFGSSKNLRKEEYIQKEQSIELGSVQNLALEFESSDLNVFFTEDSKIRVVQYSYQELEEDELFVVNQTASKISIRENRKPHFYFFYVNQTAYDVYLPREYEKSLEIKAVSGDVTVNENLKFANLTISSTSGDIEMGDIEAQNIQIETVSGDIKLQTLKEESLVLKTTSGDIFVESAEGKMELKTTSGDILMKNAIGKIEAKTTSGEIEIQTIEGNVEMQSVSGNIKCEDFKITGDSNIKTTSGEVKTYLNTESNCEIQAESTSGNITLPNRRNVMGVEPYAKLTIKTTSGNIQLEK